MSKTPNVNELVLKLRASIADLDYQVDPQFLDNNENLIRYLKSREWDVSAAAKMLRSTVQWRNECQPENIECALCRENPGVHTLRQIGFDLHQRPVIYASFYPAHESQKTSSTQGVLPHLIYVIENAVRSMAPTVNQWAFVIDCAGMSAKGCRPSLGYECAQIMSYHYPERLGLAVCIRPGPVFRTAWQAMKQFLPQATARKVRLVTKHSDLRSTLEEFFSTSMTEWIILEYEANRRKPIAKRFHPFYCPPATNGKKVSHDARGEPGYIENWVKLMHPSGHKPHPNMIDFNSGKIPAPEQVTVRSDPVDNVDEDDDITTDGMQVFYEVGEEVGVEEVKSIDEAELETAKQHIDALSNKPITSSDARQLS